MEGPVEGWLVVSEKGRRLLGYVKGCGHPLPAYFVAPRTSGWYSLRETRCLMGLQAPVALPTSGLGFLSPLEAREAFPKKCRESGRRGWCRDAQAFIEALEAASSIVGVTGSAALDPSRAGDLDLVVYGAKRGYRAYRALLEMREEGVTQPLEGPGKEWSRDDWELHRLLCGRRVLQGRYGVVEYTVRIVHCSKPVPCAPRRILGRALVLGIVVGDEASYTTPAIYPLRVLAGWSGDRVFFLTHRVRYQEIPRGSIVEVEGLVEEVDGVAEAVSPDHGGRIRLVQQPGAGAERT